LPLGYDALFTADSHMQECPAQLRQTILNSGQIIHTGTGVNNFI
jgi:hypothetical protein